MTPRNEAHSPDDNASSKKKKKGEGEWSQEEMESAEPCPMPEVPDEDERPTSPDSKK